MARPRLAEGESIPLSFRISPELDARLQAFMEETGADRSTAAREVFTRGLNVGADRPGTTVWTSKETGRPPVRDGSCPHPIGRRIGDRCGECGEPVKGKR